jgi:hypothetical protein
MNFDEYKYLYITVEYVFRANFNDTYYLETVNFPIDELVKGEPVWIDPYNGRSKSGNTQIAIGKTCDGVFIVTEKKGDTTMEKPLSLGSEHICCEDYDSSMLLSARIGLSREKRQY